MSGLLQNGTLNTRSFNLGEFKISCVLDGLARRENINQTFGIDQEPETVQALMQQNFLPPSDWTHGFTIVVLQTSDETIVFDTGFGPSGRPNGTGQMRARLSEIGLKPEDVSLVVMTHMHLDHVNGLMEEDSPAFLNARVMSSKIEFDFWLDDARLGTPAEPSAIATRNNVLPIKDRFAFFEDGDEIVPGVTAHSVFGHSPGHTAFMFESNGERLMHIADTAGHYVASFQRPDWEVLFDMDKPRAAENRWRIFGMLADEAIPMIGYHMPFPSVGYVERTQTAFRYVPATYQTDI
jgi:glyoxylase-like metal-dependent hydrolase (beta-lactamase superfamily II)